MSRSRSNNEDATKQQDLSILQKPILTPLSGFLQAKRTYENGTNEIRQILSDECDILYECKICRSVFRSLTNFINHKRVHCLKEYYKFSNCGFYKETINDISTVMQAEEDYALLSPTPSTSRGTSSIKDLSGKMERLTNRDVINRQMKLSDFYEQIINKLEKDEMHRSYHVLQLDRIPNTECAVYQTVKNNENDNIQIEVDEIQELLRSDQIVLGPDGKIIDNQQTLKMVSGDFKKCEICSLTFRTEKTLKLHIENKHDTTRYVYKCPCCIKTFMRPNSVYRHLKRNHQKSLRRIRSLRESIIRRRIRLDEPQLIRSRRKIPQLQFEKDKSDTENNVWIDKTEQNNNIPTCMYCGKTFHRKAVLTTHLNKCTTQKETITTRKFSDITNLLKDDATDKHIDKRNRTTPANTGADIESPDNVNLTQNDSRSKRKRKTIPQNSDKNEDVESEALNDMFWNFEKKSKELSLKPISLPLQNKNDTNKCEDYQLNKMTPMNASTFSNETFICHVCKKGFNALSNLRRHISMSHNQRRKFGCKLCVGRDFRKCDIINHLKTVHAMMCNGQKFKEFMYDMNENTSILESNTVNGKLNVTKSCLVSSSKGEDSVSLKRPVRNDKNYFVRDLSATMPSRDTQKYKSNRSASCTIVSNKTPEIVIKCQNNMVYTKETEFNITNNAVDSLKLCFNKSVEICAEQQIKQSSVSGSELMHEKKSNNSMNEQQSPDIIQKILLVSAVKTKKPKLAIDSSSSLTSEISTMKTNANMNDSEGDKKRLKMTSTKKNVIDENKDPQKDKIITVKYPMTEQFQEYLIVNKEINVINQFPDPPIQESSTATSNP